MHTVRRTRLGLIALAVLALLGIACDAGGGKASPQQSGAPAPAADRNPPQINPTAVPAQAGLIVWFDLYGPDGTGLDGVFALTVEADPIDPGDEIPIVDPMTGVHVPSPDYLPQVTFPKGYRLTFAPGTRDLVFIAQYSAQNAATLKCWATKDGQPIPGIEDEDTARAGLGFALLSVQCTVPATAA